MKKKEQPASKKPQGEIREPEKEKPVKLPSKSNTPEMGYHGTDKEKNLNPEE